MNQERINDELTVVGLVLVLLFLIYYLINYAYQKQYLHDKVFEAQKVAIFLNNELAKTEFELTETRNELIDIKNSQEESNKIISILKDIATSWNNGSKD